MSTPVRSSCDSALAPSIGKFTAGRHIRKSKPRLIHQPLGEGIRVRHQQAAVVNAVDIVRQKRIGNVWS